MVGELGGPRVQRILQLEALQRLTPEQQTAVDVLREKGEIPAPTRGLAPNVPEPTAGQVRGGLEMGGMALGAVGGGALGGPPGAVAGGAVGGALGSFAAETRDPTRDPLAEAGTAAAFGAGGEVLGPLAGGAARRIAAPARGAFVEGGRRTAAFLRQRNAVPLAGFLTDSRVVDLMQNVAEAAFVGGGTIQTAKQKGLDVVTGEIEKLANRIISGVSKEDAGSIVQRALENGLESFKSASSVKYAAVDEALSEFGQNAAVLDMAGAKTAALEIIQGKGLKKLNQAARGIAQEIMERPDLVTFGEAAAIRSDLLAIQRSVNELIPGRAKTVGGKLAKELDTMIDDEGSRTLLDIFGGSGADEAVDLWRGANAFWKQGAEKFNSRLVTSLLTKDPDTVINTFLRRDLVTRPRVIRELVEEAEPGAWQAVQAQFMKGLIKQGSTESGELVSSRLLNVMKQFGDETLNQVFPNKVSKNRVRFLAEALRIAEGKASKRAGGVGRVAIQLMQPGALVALGTDFALEGGLILATPAALSQVLASPKMSRWLIEGVKISRPTERFATLMRRIGTGLARTELAPPERGPQ